MTEPVPHGVVDLDALEKVAREAADGPWEAFDPNGVFDIGPTLVGQVGDHGRCGVGFLQVHSMDPGECALTARHIATFDPPTCLSLIERLRALEGGGVEGSSSRSQPCGRSSSDDEVTAGRNAEEPAADEIEVWEVLGEAYGALAAAFGRIHGLPRSEDTALANRIGRARGRIEAVKAKRQEGGRP